MVSKLPNCIWVHFLVDPRKRVLKPFLDEGWTLTHYIVREVVPVRGKAHNLVPGRSVIRVESPEQLLLPDFSNDSKNLPKQFYGVMQHPHYTSKREREVLERLSLPELIPSDHTIGVLVPIRKSEEWWGLAQDQRQAYFEKTESWEGHTGIGLKFADRIFRRLYHSRYSGVELDYDFLTYFEFEEKYERDFRELLAQLRALSNVRVM